MKAKKHYELTYHPQYRYSQINKRLYEHIKKFEIETVFEFGCNVGRHLIRLRKDGYDVFGIDVNATSVFEAKFINALRTVEVGDEQTLADIPDDSFDLVFTNSVLCHIKDVSDIIPHLQRISRKHLMMVEAIDHKGKFWYEHEYPGEVIFKRNSAINVPYRLYHWQKNKDD